MWQKDLLNRYYGGMRNRILLVTLSALVLSGCPGGGFFGRYVVVNSTGSTITNLTIAVGNGLDQSWEETLPGQGWIHSKSFGPKSLIVSWNDETGYHKEEFSFEKKTGYRSNADVYVELKPHGELAWRIIEPPAEDGNPSTIFSLVTVYFLYCLGVGVVIGVPIALAALIAYGLFMVMRTGAIAIVQGLHGDHSAFQFSIREIVLLTTVVALALGWAVHISAWMKG
jgi:hypothetical protein